MSHALCPCSPTQETLLVPKIVESPHYGVLLNKDLNRSIAKLATKNKGKSKSSAMHPTPSDLPPSRICPTQL